MNHEPQRRKMVRRQLRRRGIADAGVLDAMGRVPREAFVGWELRHRAYEDCALPIGQGQTISQPYVVALMAEALELKHDDVVLEIGTGSGYAAAVLSELALVVHTVERHADLAHEAAERLRRMGRDNVQVHVGDGSLGLSDLAPFDGISVAAAGPAVPQALCDQLANGGRLAAPVGPVEGPQILVRIRKTGSGLAHEELAEVRFVPLVGDQGWSPGSGPG